MSPTALAPVDQRAAEALARLLPTPVPLTPRPAADHERPPADAVAVVATYVGTTSAEVAVVAQHAVSEALEAAGTLTLAEALRPALDQAAHALGPGVLGPAEARRAGDVFTATGMRVHALEAGGAVQAWFALRERVNVAAAGAAPLPTGGMRVLYDVEMTLTVEIGRARLPLREVLGLTAGAVLELDRAAGSPADILVNGRLVARGEVVVVDEDYAVRVTEIVPVPETPV
jgi:flagellar motor switch protein FliN/FliY